MGKKSKKPKSDVGAASAPLPVDSSRLKADQFQDTADNFKPPPSDSPRPKLKVDQFKDGVKPPLTDSPRPKLKANLFQDTADNVKQPPPDSLRLKLKESLQLPALPGVYLMKSDQDKVLYVGKAKSLKSRVRSYFSSSDFSLKNRFLIHRMKKVDYIVTANEEEAFLLEASLIKKTPPPLQCPLEG